MALRVLIIPDKFKGTLDAFQAADAITAGWSSRRPKDSLDLLPMSDGGDGFGKVMSGLLGASIRHTRTVDAAHRDIRASWWLHEASKTAIVESATVIGLALQPGKGTHPFLLDTYGLGKVLLDAARASKKIIIGIGGSATNDGGFGLADSLGWRFRAGKRAVIHDWLRVVSAKTIKPPEKTFPPIEIIVATDVRNLLLGPRGATRVFGAQKGIIGILQESAEESLAYLAQLCRKFFKTDYAQLPGSGAAGGLGFGLAAFLGGKLEPGFELFAEYAGLPARLDRAELVITAEGSLDRSSLMGKGTGQVARMAHERGIPCLGLAGIAAQAARASKYFASIHTLRERTTMALAQAEAGRWLRETARQAAKDFSQGKKTQA